jgi:putative drug exporter of the RND superfamily
MTTTPSALRRLGRFCYRRHWLVIGAWLAAIVALGAVSAGVGGSYRESFDDFESEATRGFDLLERGFGGTAAGENIGSIVFTAEQGVDDPEVRSAITDLFAAVEDLGGPDGDVAVVDPYENPMQVAPGGDLAFARVQLPGNISFSDAQAYAEDIREHIPAVDGVEVLLGGQVFAEFEPPDSEVLGIGFAIVILILAFGSVLAMGLPIGMALGGIAAGVAVVGLVSNLLPMPDFTTTLAVMLGLGVGIDYALFIVTRFREDLHKGMAPDDAAGHAIDTAGRAVLFAGTTVVISVLGMLVMGLGFIRGIGVGAAIPVVATLVASITLLPALLGLAGDRLEVTRRRGIIAAGLVAAALVGVGLGFDALAGLIPVALVVVLAGLFLPVLKKPLPPRRYRPPRETVWYRYSRFVQHHSWLSALGGFAVLAVLALPVFGIRLGFSDEGNFPEETETRRAYDLLAEGFGPGFNGPLLLVAELPPGTDPASLAPVGEALNANEGVAFAAGPVVSEDGTVAQWFAIPATAPQDAATEQLVRDLRGPALAAANDSAGVDVLVTSFTAMSIDFSDYLGARYPLFFSVVLGLSFLLLMAVFRSVLVPLKAVLVNLLSIGAAYGIVVAIFQWGWGASLFGLAAGGAPIEPFMPMMLFAIVFGLSMDYEVFLLSRMKEEYDRTGDNANAVADGLAVTARVITAAALIMVVVFGSFLLESDRVVKLMGVGLAVAVLLDATVVRMLLVPATMELLGDRNWWLPRWLDRVLPVIHVEGGPESVDEGDDEPDPDPERELVSV